MVVLAGGVVAALAVLRSGTSGGRLIAAAALLAGAAGAALWPVAGQPSVAWLPVVSGWVLRAPRRRRLCPVPLDGTQGVQPRRGARRDVAATAVGRIDLRPAERRPGDDPLGVIVDRRSGAQAAVVSVPGQSFSLIDPEEKRRRLAAWGRVLATAGRVGSSVHRVQWIEMSWPGSAAPLREWLADAPGRHGPAGESYRELIDDAGPASQEHRVFVVVAVHPRKAASTLRRVASRGETMTEHLRREVRLLVGQLLRDELAGGHPLDVDELVAVFRAAEGCGSPSPGLGRGRHRAGGPGRPPWPMATEERWSYFRTDDSFHVTYWVSEWPRVAVGPDFLAPVISVGGVRRVALTMAPVDPRRAMRQATSDRTADLADEELRRRAGFVPSVRRSREAEGVIRREAELADGHADYRFSGYVTVSASTLDELDQRCADVEQAAQHAHLEVVRLWGRQEEAWTWTLPLGRGLA
jgi:hypothetical protein